MNPKKSKRNEPRKLFHPHEQHSYLQTELGFRFDSLIVLFILYVTGTARNWSMIRTVVKLHLTEIQDWLQLRHNYLKCIRVSDVINFRKSYLCQNHCANDKCICTVQWESECSYIGNKLLGYITVHHSGAVRCLLNTSWYLKKPS